MNFHDVKEPTACYDVFTKYIPLCYDQRDSHGHFIFGKFKKRAT